MDRTTILQQALNVLKERKSEEDTDLAIELGILKGVASYVEKEFDLHESLKKDVVKAVKDVNIVVKAPQVNVEAPDLTKLETLYEEILAKLSEPQEIELEIV